MSELVLNGLPASPGVHVGEAVVARNLPDVAAIHSTAVLVLRFANMEWLEAISRVGAVVTEFGGRTSHAASICRELGKPCVTGVAGITSLVDSGALLVVDGRKGTVTIRLC